MLRYAKPKTVDEALALLGGDAWRVLAGGTDFYPAKGSAPLRENVLDINGLSELRGISETPSHWIIGARTTWTAVCQAQLPPAFDGLKQAAREVGALQIQNVGTIAGNLCNASPAADGVPPLLVLNAEVELRAAAGIRHVALGGFIQGNRKTARRPDELLTSIRVPKESCDGYSSFLKLGARRYLVISIAMVAARVVVAGGRLASVALAVGSCSAVAQRLRELERALAGCPMDEIETRLRSASIPEISPIDDVRGSAGYRRQIVGELVSRAVRAATQSQMELQA